MPRMLRNALPRRTASLAVFAYLFFLLSPHVAAVTHNHAGGAQGHTHAFLSAHDLTLERAALQAAPEGTPNGELDRNEAPRPKFPVDEGGKSLVDPAHAAHTHVQEDPNLAGIGVPAFPDPVPEARPEAPRFALAFAPAPAPLSASARAPPGRTLIAPPPRG